MLFTSTFSSNLCVPRVPALPRRPPTSLLPACLSAGQTCLSALPCGRLISQRITPGHSISFVVRKAGWRQSSSTNTSLCSYCGWHGRGRGGGGASSAVHLWDSRDRQTSPGRFVMRLPPSVVFIAFLPSIFMLRFP